MLKKLLILGFILVSIGKVYAQSKFVDQTGTLIDSTAMLGTYVKRPDHKGTLNYLPKFTGTYTIGNSSIFDNGKVGIGTSSPTQLFTIQGTNGQPVITGTTSNAVARIGGNSNHALDIGSYNDLPYGSYLQSTDKGNLATNLPLTLNPVGGNVGIGTNTPSQRFTIFGTNGDPSTPTGGSTYNLWTTNSIFRIDGGTNHAIDMGTYASSPYGGYIQSINRSVANSLLNLVLNPSGGNVGIGTTTSNVGSKLEVNGASTNTTAYNAGAGTSIDFTKSNLAYTTANAGSITLTGMKDGGTYTLAVQGATSGTASFTGSNPSAVAFTFKGINNGATIASKHTLYTFIVMGTNVYYSMASGF